MTIEVESRVLSPTAKMEERCEMCGATPIAARCEGVRSDALTLVFCKDCAEIHEQCCRAIRKGTTRMVWISDGE